MATLAMATPYHGPHSPYTHQVSNVTLNKEGPIHDVQWSPEGGAFALTSNPSPLTPPPLTLNLSPNSNPSQARPLTPKPKPPPFTRRVRRRLRLLAIAHRALQQQVRDGLRPSPSPSLVRVATAGPNQVVTLSPTP